MPSITLIIADLGPGGAQRVLVWLANRWARSGRTVEMITLDDGARPPHHELDAGVRRRHLAVARPSRGPLDAARSNLRRLAALRRALDVGRPAPVLSFIDTTNVLAALAGATAGRPVVVSERIDPYEHRIGRAWRVARAATYPLAARIVVQSERARAFFGVRLRDRVDVIPNPVVVPAERGTTRQARTWVAMGRLDRQKGFDLLLESFARSGLADDGWSLAIWGEGPERVALEELGDRLGLATKVRFPGVTRDATTVLGAAEAFVLPSRYEGFPNVLCEALAARTACVAFDCPTGPAEILEGGRAGVLVPNGDVDALARAMRRVAHEPELRAALRARAAGSVARYEPREIGDRWDRVIAAVSPGWSRPPASGRGAAS